MGEQNVVQYVGVGIFAISMLTAIVADRRNPIDGSPCKRRSLLDALFMLGIVGAFIGAGLAAL
jgi:hypothetical protein